MMLMAFMLFAFMDSTAKWLVAAALPPLQVAMVRYLGHFAWTLIVYMPRHGFSVFKSNSAGLQALRALFLLTGTVLNFVALKYLPLTTTIAVFFASPLVVCLLSIPVLGETVGLRRLLAVLVGFVGVLIIVRPGFDDFDPAVFYSLGAMCGASCYFVMTRKLAGTDNNAVAQCFAAGIASLVMLPLGMGVWVWPQSDMEWLLLAALGTFGMMGHSLLTRAHLYAEASVLAPTVYSQIIFITAISWIIFDSPPDLPTTIGTLIIVGSGVYIWWRERTLAKRDSAITIRGGR